MAIGFIYIKTLSFSTKLREKGASLQRGAFIHSQNGVSSDDLPHSEIDFVEPNRVVVHRTVPILLIVDGYAVPFCGSRRTVDI